MNIIYLTSSFFLEFLKKKAKQMPIYTIYNSGFICSDHIVVIYIFLFDIVTYAYLQAFIFFFISEQNPQSTWSEL